MVLRGFHEAGEELALGEGEAELHFFSLRARSSLGSFLSALRSMATKVTCGTGTSDRLTDLHHPAGGEGGGGGEEEEGVHCS